MRRGAICLFANNPDYKTARDIVEIRHIKANLVSVNVDRLVQEGYLVRKPVKGDQWKAGYAGVCALRDLYTALGTDRRKICQ